MPAKTEDAKPSVIANYINGGILLTLLTYAYIGGNHMQSMESSIEGVTEAVVELKDEVKRNTNSINSDGRVTAALMARVNLLERRIEALEKE